MHIEDKEQLPCSIVSKAVCATENKEREQSSFNCPETDNVTEGGLLIYMRRVGGAFFPSLVKAFGMKIVPYEPKNHSALARAIASNSDSGYSLLSNLIRTKIKEFILLSGTSVFHFKSKSRPCISPHYGVSQHLGVSSAILAASSFATK